MHPSIGIRTVLRRLWERWTGSPPPSRSDADYDPSAVHRLLLERIEPRLRFDDREPQGWQSALSAQLRELLGSSPLPASQLAVHRLWKREHPLGSIEKLRFTSETQSDVPAYFCLPHDRRPPHPFAICLQGHSSGMHLSIGMDRKERRIRNSPGDRDLALGCMARGIGALCIEQRALGERLFRRIPVIERDLCVEPAMHALLLGRTLLGERVFDVERAIDYLETREEVDRTRIGLVGHSGGGTVGIYAAALSERLSFLMPSAAFCTFSDSILSVRHCVDNYVPRLALYAEMDDILGLFAPRPVVVVTGNEDPVFPLPGVRRAFEGLERIYTAGGAAERCRLVVGHGGHRFFADAAWPEMLEQIERL